MAITWEDFKQCVRIQGQLDFEAIDVAFIQPLKDLQAWWGRQSAKTQAYISFLTAGGGLTAKALAAFLKSVLGAEGAAVADAFWAELGAVLIGVSLGVAQDIISRCQLQAVESVVQPH